MVDVSEIIINTVNKHAGIKGIELVTKIIKAIYEENGDLNQDIVEDINSLVLRGKIVEVEYVLETASNRTKTMYFPANTQLVVFPRNAFKG